MILIGTMHYDIEGTKRLEHILNHFKPRKITMEWTSSQSVEEIENEILATRESMMETMNSWTEINPCVRGLLTDLFSQRFYDALVPIQYAKHRQVEVYPVDHPELIKFGLAGYMEGVQKAIIDSITELPPISYDKVRDQFGKMLDHLYVDHSFFEEFYPELTPEKQEVVEMVDKLIIESAEDREQYMADQIRQQNPDLHVGGMAHVFDNFSDALTVTPLYQRLGDLVTRRIALREAYNLL